MDSWQDLDKKHVWHPYASLPYNGKNLAVKKTLKTKIYLEDGRVLLDGMSSWWSAIHGYNHPKLKKALVKQAKKMPHIMFGGLSHKQPALLAKMLSDLTCLPSVFFCDSGSVAVEVALKTAISYYKARAENLGVKADEKKCKFISLEYAYHGDTLGAMSVCDPVNSMHKIYGSYVQKQIFTKAPELGFDSSCEEAIEALEQTLKKYHKQSAALILEPIVQGAGGMRIYSPIFLQNARKLCDKYDVLLIADEIATGFGHTGKMFACEHAKIKPDIMLLGKSLTGGYLSLAVMLTNKEISDMISKQGAKSDIQALMHGPTFMANALSCAVALSSLKLLLKSPWEKRLKNIEEIFEIELAKAKTNSLVKDVRNIGAIGVIELKRTEYASLLQDFCVSHGVWLRPFSNLFYAIVAYTISEKDLKKIITTMIEALKFVEKGLKNERK